MKTIFKNRIVWSMVSSLIIYLAASFICWDITVIKRLPEFDGFLRSFLLIIFVAKEAMVQLIFTEYYR